MKRPLLSIEKVDISTYYSSSSSSDADNDVFGSIQLNDDPPESSPEAWLLRKAQSYQEYMKLIPIPTDGDQVIPYTSWTGLGSTIKKIYEQPLPT